MPAEPEPGLCSGSADVADADVADPVVVEFLVSEPARLRPGWGGDAPQPRICAAMIAKDEERFLAGCLESIAGEVDDVVVVDTGSRDATPDIARHHGARLHRIDWTGDFSAAINHALDHASGDWILYIDADERLRCPHPGDLRRAVADPAAAAVLLRLRPKMNSTCYHEIRLFRRDERIRFRSAIHETVHPAILDVCRSDGQSIVRADVGIDHLGYEGDLTHKFVRNLEPLQRSVAATPERVFLWVDLGASLAGLGRRDEAIAAHRMAIAQSLRTDNAKHRRDAARAWQHLIALHVDADPALAAEIAAEAVAAYPDDHALRLAALGARFGAGDTGPVPPELRDLAAIDAETLFDPMVAYDKRIFGEWAWDLIGAYSVRNGDRDGARAAYSRAAELAPDNLAYRAKASAFGGMQR